MQNEGDLRRVATGQRLEPEDEGARGGIVNVRHSRLIGPTRIPEVYKGLGISPGSNVGDILWVFYHEAS